MKGIYMVEELWRERERERGVRRGSRNCSIKLYFRHFQQLC